MKPMLMSSLVLALPLAALAPLPAAQLPMPDGPCPNSIHHELVVSYEVTGGTLSGPIDFQLSVYSDGSARLSSAPGSNAGVLFRASVGPNEVAALRGGLIAAGALRHCDALFPVSDTPLSTLTVLRGPSRQVANSFSWFSADPEIGDMIALLQAFITAHFPPLPGGGGTSF